MPSSPKKSRIDLDLGHNVLSNARITTNAFSGAGVGELRYNSTADVLAWWTSGGTERKITDLSLSSFLGTNTSSLNLNSQSLINVNLINSVDITTHASRHQHGGADEVGTATPTANAIPKADGSSKLDSWVTYAPSGTDVAIIDGGTGASTASGARTNLGLAIGTDVQAFSSNLSTIAGISANGLITRTGLGAYTNRSIVGTTNRIVVTNPSGIAGDPTLDIGTDVVTLTGTQTLTNKSIVASQITGVLSEANGGTNQSTYALGDILSASATNTLSKVSGNTTTTRQFLRQTGTGVISALPVWDTVTKTDVGLSAVENTALSTWAGTTNLTTLGTVATGTWSATTIDINKGGTGQSTANAGFNALAPSQTGNAGRLLTTNATDTSWSELFIQNPSTPTSATASGTNAIGLGNGAVASGQESIVLGGATNTASARYASAIGNQAKSDIQGGFAQASGMFTAQGDAQTRVFVMRTQTTNNTATEMFIDGTAGSVRVVLPNDSSWLFRVSIVGRRTNADNESAMYQLLGGIDRNATAGTTALVGTVGKTVIAEDNATWDVSATADTTNGSLKLTVTGQNAKTVNWVARIELTEVTG